MNGQTPQTIDVDLLDGTDNNIPLLMPDGNVRQMQANRRAARQAFEEVQANKKLRQAQLSRTRARNQYSTGDLVWYWRRPKGSKKVGAAQGQWLGPALVMSHQPRRDHITVIPSGIVWIVSNGYILRVAPEHVKLCSESDREIDSMVHGPSGSLQEIIHRVAQPEQVEDLTTQLGPDVSEEDKVPEISPASGIERPLRRDGDSPVTPVTTPRNSGETGVMSAPKIIPNIDKKKRDEKPVQSGPVPPVSIRVPPA